MPHPYPPERLSNGSFEVRCGACLVSRPMLGVSEDTALAILAAEGWIAVRPPHGLWPWRCSEHHSTEPVIPRRPSRGRYG